MRSPDCRDEATPPPSSHSFLHLRNTAMYPVKTEGKSFALRNLISREERPMGRPPRGTSVRRDCIAAGASLSRDSLGRQRRRLRACFKHNYYA